MFTTHFHLFLIQPNMGLLDQPAAGGSAGGMLDRSRMALCAFTFLFLSMNPLASLLCSSSSSTSANTGTASNHHTGRGILGLESAGRQVPMQGWIVLQFSRFSLSLSISMFVSRRLFPLTEI